jgi:hypothetical protein
MGVGILQIKQRTVAIDRDHVMDLIEVLDGANSKESFIMLCLVLSLVYRTALVDEGMTVLEFLDDIKRQVAGLIDNPPEGFRDEDNEPTEDCDCDICCAKRAWQERRKARAH